MSSSTENSIVICVFCGASAPKNPAYLAGAKALAEAMHRAGAKLVYGGGTFGMMGEVARTLVRLSGPDAVHGIIPEALIKYEQAGAVTVHDSNTGNDGYATGTTTTTSAQAGGGGDASSGAGARDVRAVPDPAIYGRTTVVRDMHSRKALMAKSVMEGAPGSGFVALPGGYGTMEELMEITTWNQLGIHKMPVVLLNTNGFYDGLIAWVRLAVADGFIVEANKDIIIEATDPDAVLRALTEYKVAEGRYKLDWTATSPAEEKKDEK